MNIPEFSTVKSNEFGPGRRTRDYTRFDLVANEYLNGDAILLTELLGYLNIKEDTLRAYARDREKERGFKMSIRTHPESREKYVLFYTKKQRNGT